MSTVKTNLPQERHHRLHTKTAPVLIPVPLAFLPAGLLGCPDADGIHGVLTGEIVVDDEPVQPRNAFFIVLGEFLHEGQNILAAQKGVGVFGLKDGGLGMGKRISIFIFVFISILI